MPDSLLIHGDADLSTTLIAMDGFVQIVGRFRPAYHPTRVRSRSSIARDIAVVGSRAIDAERIAMFGYEENFVTARPCEMLADQLPQ